MKLAAVIATGMLASPALAAPVEARDAAGLERRVPVSYTPASPRAL